MSPVATTEYGKVRGIKITSELNFEYISFYGIPYAEPPLGKLRFKDPIPPIRWTDIFDATTEKLQCLGVDAQLQTVVGSEDCLNINIFTKSLSPEKSYPVIFYIYGGGNAGTNSTKIYAPDFLLLSDVIVVTFNFRYGPFGYMSFKDPSLNVPGNASLKDQLMALKFVKNNIQHFGGDPNNITMCGHSFGALATNWHLASERSKDLFNRAIIMAGSVYVGDFFIPQDKNWPLRLAMRLGYTGSDNERDILEFLQNADSIEMTKEQHNIVLPEERNSILLAFGPHIEPYITDRTFIYDTPLNMMRDAWSKDIDCMVGCTADEGMFFLSHVKAAPAMITHLRLENIIPNEINLEEKKRLKLVERIRSFYYGKCDNPNDIESEEAKVAFSKWMGDKFFKHPLSRIIRCRQKSNGKGRTYLYRFAFDSPTHNRFRITVKNRPNIRGVHHADEVAYMLKQNYEPICGRDSMEFVMVQRFVSIITSFVANGNPLSNINNADMQNVQWHPIDKKDPSFNCLNIDENLEFKEFLENENILFWDQIFNETNTPLI